MNNIFFYPILWCLSFLPWHIYSVPSSSMWPTIPVGISIVVDRDTPESAYEVGDIVAFRAKLRSGDVERQIFIKRIVARGGDTVQMISGRLVVNGTQLQRDPTKPMPAKDSFGRNMEVPCYFETNRVARYRVCEINGDNGYYDNTDKYVVPSNSYFLMGDNRDNSDDSRDLNEIGYVSASDLVGKVNFLLN